MPDLAAGGSASEPLGSPPRPRRTAAAALEPGPPPPAPPHLARWIISVAVYGEGRRTSDNLYSIGFGEAPLLPSDWLESPRISLLCESECGWKAKC